MLAKRPAFAIGDSLAMYDSTGVCPRVIAMCDSAGVCPKTFAMQANTKVVSNTPKLRMVKGKKRSC
jgi:hypothetical protein